MATNAAQKRFDTINEIAEQTRHVRYTDAGQPEVIWTRFFGDRVAVADSIRSLASLGRTARWAEGVESWAVAVEESTEENFRWSFDQYLIFACYAAE